MSAALATAWAAVLGSALQMFLLLWPGDITRSEKRLFSMCLPVAGLLAFLPGRRETEYVLHHHVWMLVLAFIIVFLCIFPKRILPAIGEYELVIWNTLAITIFPFTSVGQHPVFLTILLCFSVVSLCLLVTPSIPDKTGKFVLYTVFLIIVVTFGILQLMPVLSGLLHQSDQELVPSLFTAFITGMALFLTGCKIFFLFMLLPIPGKRQTLKDRMKQWHKDVALMRSQYDDSQIHFMSHILIIFVIGGLGVANSLFSVLPTIIFASIVIVLAPYIKPVPQSLAS